MTEFTRFARPSRLHLTAMVFLWGAFAFLTISVLIRTDGAVSDPVKLKELQNSPLTPKRQGISGQSSADDWPQWRGPNRDGVSTATGLLTAWPPAGPRKLWEASTGEGFSSMAVHQGRVYSMAQDGEQEAIICWDAETGRELWRHRYAASFRNSYGNGPRSTPTIDGDLLFAVGGTGIMTCLKISAIQPEVLWSKRLLEEFGAKNLTWGVANSPLVDGDLVYVNPGGPDGHSVAALEKLTGAVRWQALDDIAGYSSPIIADLADERQVIFFTERGLVGLTPDKGKLLWRFPWTTDYGTNIATPIVAGDYVFISSGYGTGCALVKIDKTDTGLAASLVYKNRNMKTHFSSGVRYHDHIYGFDDTLLICMELRTGAVVWKQKGFHKGALTIADGHLFILGEKGTLAVAPASPDAYHEKGRCQFSEQRCWTVPVVANGRLYVRDQDRIACYSLKE
jgi:outer membrane protein assembly factor BamB